MGVLLFYFELFIFGRAGSSLRRRHSSSCVELRPLKQGWVVFSGCCPLVGGASRGAAFCGRCFWGAALLWAGLIGCGPLVGGASWVRPSCGQGFLGTALLWAGLLGAALLWAGLEGCCPLVGGAVGGTGFSSFH